MPAAAVYLRDPDGHLLEYLAMLDENPQPERGIIPWSEWQVPRRDRSKRLPGSRIPR